MNKNDFSRHLTWILDWWSDFVDWEDGGIFTFVKPLQKEPASPRKMALMHLRQLYNYSVGFEENVAGSEEVAHHLYRTFDLLFAERERGLLVETQLRGTKGPVCSGYNNAYAVIGLCRYARAFGHRGAAEKALGFYQALADIFTDLPLEKKGSWYYWDPEKDAFHSKADNPVIHRFEAALNLWMALKHTAPDLAETHRRFLKDEMNQMAVFFEHTIARPEDGYTVEHLEDDGSPHVHLHSRPQSLAHGFEWIGFLIEAEEHAGLSSEFLNTRGSTLARQSLDNGLRDSGCFCNGWIPGMKRAPLQAEFWPQAEAILGSLWSRKRWGEHIFPMEEAERLKRFYDENLFKEEILGGGILSAVSENGAPVSFSTGHAAKCDHHAVRMCEKIFAYNLLSPGGIT